MKKIVLATAVLALGFASCKENKTDNLEQDILINDTITEIAPDMSTSEIALDWAGTYVGTLPCADCSGIETSITLNDNNTFDYKATYIGRSNSTIEEKGTIMWHDGTIVHLKGATINAKYKVQEGNIVALDQEGNVIEGALKDKYILTKK